MPFRRWLKEHYKKSSKNKNQVYEVQDEEQEEQQISPSTTLIYLACNTSKDNLTNLLQNFSTNVKIFTNENECIESIKSITDPIFLIIDDSPSKTFIEQIENLQQIDSIFIYSSSSESVQIFNEKSSNYSINWCENESVLIDTIYKSQEEHDKYLAAFSICKKKKNILHNLSKDSGSFVFFQIFLFIMQYLPKTIESKQNLIRIARNYYRGNLDELENILEFDQQYTSTQAISWYLKEDFVYKLMNECLSIENISFLYEFRYYILDLTEQIQDNCSQLKHKRQTIPRLYRHAILTDDDLKKLQNNTGNLISINGYLSLYSQQSTAYDLAKKINKTDNVQSALFEYHFDLNVLKKIFIADIEKYKTSSEQPDFLVDIGASFQIDSCIYKTEEDFWYIKVHATDQGANLASEYIEYEKKRISQLNTVLIIGNFLIEMGEYTKAERYFDTVLKLSDPNNEETASIYFNLARTYRLQGDLDRAIDCYKHAYNFHTTDKRKCPVNAGKDLNGLGIVHSQQGRFETAEEYFNQAMELFRKNLPKKHIYIAATLLNLSTIDCTRRDYHEATIKSTQAKKIYDSSLPHGHPNRALPSINLGNIYLATGQYEMAMEEYQNARKLQEISLPYDHPDRAVPRINLGNGYLMIGQYEKALEEYENAFKILEESLPSNHPDRIQASNNIELVRQRLQNPKAENDSEINIMEKIRNIMVD